MTLLLVILSFLLGFLFGMSFYYSHFKIKIRMGMKPYIAKDKTLQWIDK